MDAISVSYAHPGHSRRLEGVRRLVLSGLVVALAGTLALHGVAGMLEASAAGPEDGGAASVRSTPRRPMFELRALEPGTTATGFAHVTYDGATPGQIRLFATVRDGGLAPFLIVTVTRGAGGGTDFVPDRNGVAFSGPLAEFPTGWNDGVVGGVTLDAGDSASYRFDVRLTGDAPPGATADASFGWEARTS